MRPFEAICLILAFCGGAEASGGWSVHDAQSVALGRHLPLARPTAWANPGCLVGAGERWRLALTGTRPFALSELSTATFSVLRQTETHGFAFGVASFGSDEYRETGVRASLGFPLAGFGGIGAFVEAVTIHIPGYDVSAAGSAGLGAVAALSEHLAASVQIKHSGFPTTGELLLPESSAASAAISYTPASAATVFGSVDYESSTGWTSGVAASISAAEWLALYVGKFSNPPALGAGCEVSVASLSAAYGVRFYDILPSTHSITLTIPW